MRREVGLIPGHWLNWQHQRHQPCAVANNDEIGSGGDLMRLRIFDEMFVSTRNESGNRC